MHNKSEKIMILVILICFLTTLGVLFYYEQSINELRLKQLIVKKQILDTNVCIPFDERGITRITLHPLLPYRDTINIQIILK